MQIADPYRNLEIVKPSLNQAHSVKNLATSTSILHQGSSLNLGLSHMSRTSRAGTLANQWLDTTQLGRSGELGVVSETSEETANESHINTQRSPQNIPPPSAAPEGQVSVYQEKLQKAKETLARIRL